MALEVERLVMAARQAGPSVEDLHDNKQQYHDMIAWNDHSSVQVCADDWVPFLGFSSRRP